MLTSLVWPIVISTVVLFFASFLSWMVLQLHKQDWKKLAKEDDVMLAVKKCDPPVGSYMFPACDSHAEMQTEAFKTKYAAGPRGMNRLPKGEVQVVVVRLAAVPVLTILRATFVHDALVVHDDEVVAVALEVGPKPLETRLRVVQPPVMGVVIVTVPHEHPPFHRKDERGFCLICDRRDLGHRRVFYPAVLRLER